MKVTEVLTEAQKEQFALAHGLAPKNYQITASLGDVGTWRAKILVANSAMENQKVGDWDTVGYVMINLKSNEIIPIARADEHNTGFDLLYRFQRKRMKIEISDYLPVYNGGNYIYKESQIAPMTVAIKKWLAYGGPDETIKGAYGVSLFGTFRDLAQHEAKLMSAPDKLSIVGERIIKGFQALFQLNDRRVIQARSGRDTNAIDQTFFRTASTFAKMVAPIMNAMWITKPSPDTLVQTVADFVTQQDIDGLERFFFGFHSVKNVIHQAIRQTKDNSYLRGDTVHSVFGNLELADQMLGGL